MADKRENTLFFEEQKHKEKIFYKMLKGNILNKEVWDLVKEEVKDINGDIIYKVESYFLDSGARFDIATNFFYRIIRINYNSITDYLYLKKEQYKNIWRTKINLNKPNYYLIVLDYLKTEPQALKCDDSFYDQKTYQILKHYLDKNKEFRKEIKRDKFLGNNKE